MHYPDNDKSEDSGKNINEDEIGVRNANPWHKPNNENRIKKHEAEIADLNQLPQGAKR